MVRHQHAGIAGLAVVEPSELVASSAIEARLAPLSSRLQLMPDAIVALTGIETRGFFAPGTVPSDIAAAAGRAALADAGVDASDVDVVISCSVSQDHVEPATAAAVHGKLGLARACLNFDLKNACLGFVSALDLAGTLIDSGRVGVVLVVAGEVSREIVDATIARLQHPDATLHDYRTQFVSLTLGSAGCAAVVAHSDAGFRQHHRLLRSYSVADGTHHGLCVGEMHEMRVDAKALTLAGLILGSEGIRDAKAAFGDASFDYPCYVMHQTSRPHLEKFCDLIDVDAARFERTYPRYGNVGSCGVPLTLHQAVRGGRIQVGQKVPLLGVGSGLNAAWLEVEW